MIHRFLLSNSCFDTFNVSLCNFSITRQPKEQRHVDIDSFSDKPDDSGQPFDSCRNFDKNVGSFKRSPQPSGFFNCNFGVMRQMRVDLKADISIPAVGFFIHRSELVGSALHIVPAESFIYFLGVSFFKRCIPDILIVNMAFNDRLLKDGRIRGHPAQPVFVDQTSKLAAGDQVPPDVVQPDGLAKRF